MSKKICSDYNANLKSQILLADFIKNNLNKINNFLHIVAKRDESLIVKLLPLYKKLLDKMAIDSTKKAFFNQFNFPFIENKWLNEYPDFIPLVENATLKFLNFTKYKSHFVIGEKLDVFYRDVIRGEFYPLYYLALPLLEITTRDFTIEIAKEFTDYFYELIQVQFKKKETLLDFATHECYKTHNYISLVDDKYYLKITRCMWGEIYQELPDLELAYYLECYGDFSLLPYVNPHFVLTRTKTLVEGYPFCDFVYHDKRISNEIKHPNENFWKNIK